MRGGYGRLGWRNGTLAFSYESGTRIDPAHIDIQIQSYASDVPDIYVSGTPAKGLNLVSLPSFALVEEHADQYRMRCRPAGPTGSFKRHVRDYETFTYCWLQFTIDEFYVNIWTYIDEDLVTSEDVDIVIAHFFAEYASWGRE